MTYTRQNRGQIARRMERAFLPVFAFLFFGIAMQQTHSLNVDSDDPPVHVTMGFMPRAAIS